MRLLYMSLQSLCQDPVSIVQKRLIGSMQLRWATLDWEACCENAQHSSGGEAASLSEIAGRASAALPTLQGPTLAERFR